MNTRAINRNEDVKKRHKTGNKEKEPTSGGRVERVRGKMGESLEVAKGWRMRVGGNGGERRKRESGIQGGGDRQNVEM